MASITLAMSKRMIFLNVALTQFTALFGAELSISFHAFFAFVCILWIEQSFASITVRYVPDSAQARSTESCFFDV